MSFGQPPQQPGGFGQQQQQPYDDTNKGVVFQAQQNESFLGCGKLNIDGKEFGVSVIQRPINAEGRIEYVLYAKIGVLFTNTPRPGEQLHEKAPQYNGPLDHFPNKKMAAWVGEKDGRHYLQLKVEDKQEQQAPANPFGGAPQQQPQQPAPDTGFSADDIPF